MALIREVSEVVLNIAERNTVEHARLTMVDDLGRVPFLGALVQRDGVDMTVWVLGFVLLEEGAGRGLLARDNYGAHGATHALLERLVVGQYGLVLQPIADALQHVVIPAVLALDEAVKDDLARHLLVEQILGHLLHVRHR